MTSARPSARRGLLLGIGAYAMWGLFPLYWPHLEPASATEILANRMLWSLVFVAVVLTLRRRWAPVAALRAEPRRLALLFAAAVLVAVNWGVYIWGVNSGKVVETSLGYFVNPLVTVLLGVVVLRERLRPLQWAAVGVGLVAIIELVVAYGQVPWIALVLAFSFGLYGLCKKLAAVPALESMAVETAYQFFPALAYMVYLQVAGTAAFGHTHWPVTVLLVGAGVVTALPLISFAAAVNLASLSSLGLVFYLTPVLQLLCGVFVAHEAVPGSEWVGFGIVWGSLGVLTVDSLREARRAARAGADSTVGAGTDANTDANTGTDTAIGAGTDVSAGLR